jgi:DNA-binding ferritin-like protein
MEPGLAELLKLWACLRASHHVYWTLHWKSKGQPFYGDHLLFERLYTGRVEEIDGLAEIIAGHFGSDKLDAVQSWTDALEVVKAMMASPTPIGIAQMVLDAVEVANESCATCKYPASTQNFISGVGTNHLSALYLLKQRYGALAAKSQA